MIYPLKGELVVTGEYKEAAQPGTGLKDASGVARHIGVDYRARTPQPVYAPGSGVVTASVTNPSGNQVIELRIDGKLWRFLHLSNRLVRNGQAVGVGQQIGSSGSSGGVAPHLHVDCRKDGTTWSASLANYFDPRAVIEEANKPRFVLRNYIPANAVGRRVYLSSRCATWNVYKPGTRTLAGVLKPAANPGMSYIVRGVDSLPNRVLIQSGTFGRVSLPVDGDATFK